MSRVSRGYHAQEDPSSVRDFAIEGDASSMTLSFLDASPADEQGDTIILEVKVSRVGSRPSMLPGGKYPGPQGFGKDFPGAMR